MGEITTGNAERPRRVLERIVLRRGSFRGLGASCGRSPMWIWRQLRENKGLDLVKTEKVLEHLGVPARFFYEELADSAEPYDPIWLLEHFREEQTFPRDPFLGAVEIRLTELSSRSSMPGGKRQRRRLSELDDLRYFERARAKGDLEKLALEILATVEATPDLRRGPLADLAQILLIWGAIQRGRARLEDAADAYSLGYRLAVAARDLKGVGIFFNYASYLLAAELKQPVAGLRFAEAACSIFQQLRERDLLSQVLIASGIALYRLERFEEQRNRIIGALRSASRRSWPCRVAAWIQLANLALVRGEPRAALGKIQRAQKWTHGCKHVRAFLFLREAIIWREVAMPSDLGRPVTESARAYRQAIRGFAEADEDFEGVLAAIELAELLTSAGRLAEAATAVRDTMPLFERLDGGTPVYSCWLDLLALLLRGTRETAHRQVLSVREAVQADAAKIRLFLGNSRSLSRRQGVGMPPLMKIQES